MNCLINKQKLIQVSLTLNIISFAVSSASANTITPYRTIRYQGVVGQTSYYTCGPAAVATLLIHYYKINTSEKEILELAHQAIKESGKNPEEGKGINALALKKALANKGILSKGIKIQPEILPNYFNQGGVPLVIHVTRPQLHYVLAIGMLGDLVVIADPSWGRKIIHLKDLINDKGFQGVTLIPLTPRPLLSQIKREQKNTLNWAKQRLSRLGKGVNN
ncbi:putative peptidase [Microcystis aeruginosa NIES-2481]|uniref:Bacteriocin-processing peptidase n=1 Tax=Microcystis aeruginosa NIES-3787 TaxID=2517782 RepID=A0A6H9GDX8_MICAE|nr:cysteine peptidase family C39 domain-containing protein [Microcystis aeruginosa]AOC51379.1 putative peptidase [Microcystis aeruginosa NIES-2481]GCL48274.1 bacteriocin-processing peptidase [Microcystis aeruginosa NIES-3787]